jgi:hypothetical protein
VPQRIVAAPPVCVVVASLFGNLNRPINGPRAVVRKTRVACEDFEFCSAESSFANVEQLANTLATCDLRQSSVNNRFPKLAERRDLRGFAPQRRNMHAKTVFAAAESWPDPTTARPVEFATLNPSAPYSLGKLCRSVKLAKHTGR